MLLGENDITVIENHKEFEDVQLWWPDHIFPSYLETIFLASTDANKISYFIQKLPSHLQQHAAMHDILSMVGRCMYIRLPRNQLYKKMQHLD